jgi:hypothetical protein
MTNFNKPKNSLATKVDLDLGERKVSRMNFSYIVTLPKIFVRNTPYGEIRAVRITMLEDGSLKLVPIHRKNEDGSAEFVTM